jgi:hypothetical protein
MCRDKIEEEEKRATPTEKNVDDGQSEQNNAKSTVSTPIVNKTDVSIESTGDTSPSNVASLVSRLSASASAATTTTTTTTTTTAAAPTTPTTRTNTTTTDVATSSTEKRAIIKTTSGGGGAPANAAPARRSSASNSDSSTRATQLAASPPQTTLGRGSVKNLISKFATLSQTSTPTGNRFFFLYI